MCFKRCILVDPDQDAPEIRQCQETQQPLHMAGKRHVRIFQMKALGFQRPEQAFNFPALAISLENATRRRGVARHNQGFPLIRPGQDHIHRQTVDLHAFDPERLHSGLQAAQPLTRWQVVNASVDAKTDGDRESSPSQPFNPYLADEFPVSVNRGDFAAFQELQGIVEQGQPGVRTAIAAVRQQLKQQWHSNAPPIYRQHHRIHIGLAQFPIGAVHDEFPSFFVRQQGQYQTSDIQGTQRMLVKESLDLADDGSCLSVAGATLGQCRVAHVFGSNQRQDEQSEQFHLIFAVCREVGSEAQTQ